MKILRGEKAECPERFDTSGCYYLQKEDRYYISSQEDNEGRLSFKDAEARCAELGGELAQIDSTEEQEFLSALATNEGVWIGLKRIDSVWKWIPSKKEVTALHQRVI